MASCLDETKKYIADDLLQYWITGYNGHNMLLKLMVGLLDF